MLYSDLEFSTDERGALVITGDAEAREELAEIYAERGYWAAWCEAFEVESCNGSYTIFDAGDANPFVGLTDAPCIAESMSYDDEGNAEIEGRLWWCHDYMIRDELRELIETGQTRFALAGEYEAPALAA